MRRVYLDYNSTTPLDPEVFRAMEPYLKEYFGNPSNIHSFGRETREAIEQAREDVANLIGALPEEIFFTSGGSEANNWAIKGIIASIRDKNHIITSPIEHHSVTNTCEYLKTLGVEITYLPVDEFGLVNLEDVKKAIRKNTSLITIMHSNNEVGTIEPIQEIGEITKNAGIYFHTDAVASCGKLELDVNSLGVDLLTLSAHKIHGPKGIGALYIRKGTKIENLLHGGHQEKGLRSGTENLYGIVGFGKAARIIKETALQENRKIKELRDYLEKRIFNEIPEVKLNGHPEKRLGNTLHIGVGYVEGESLLMNLDLEGIAVSSGSACASGETEPSPVLKAMSVPDIFINSPLRFTLGKENTKEEIDYTVDVLKSVVKRLREISPLWKKK